MAVIQSRPGLYVTVEVGDRPVREYRDPDNDYNRVQYYHEVENYIESRPGFYFSIMVRVNHNFQFLGRTVSFSVSVDGKFMLARIFPHLQVGSTSFRVLGVEYPKNGEMALRRFVFAPLDIVEEDRSVKITENFVKSLAAVGTISVTFHEKTNVQPTEWKGDVGSTALEKYGRVPEKALKGSAVSHATDLGEPEQLGYSYTPECWRSEQIGEPIATFNFKYRSKRALQELRIIPRAATPEPIERRAVDNLSLEEARELARRYQATLPTTPPPRIKREGEAIMPPKFNSEPLPTDDDECSFIEQRPVKRVRTHVELDD